MSELVVIPLGEPKVLCVNPSEEVLDILCSQYKNHLIMLGEEVLHIPQAPGTVEPTETTANEQMDTIPLRIVTPTNTKVEVEMTLPIATGKKRGRRTKAEMEAARAAEAGIAPPPPITSIMHTEIPVPPMEEPAPPTIVLAKEPEEDEGTPEIEKELANGELEDVFDGK